VSKIKVLPIFPIALKEPLTVLVQFESVYGRLKKKSTASAMAEVERIIPFNFTDMAT